MMYNKQLPSNGDPQNGTPKFGLCGGGFRAGL